MQISWLGYGAFRITSGGTTVIINPTDRAANFKIHKQSADIVVASDAEARAGDAIAGAPFLIDEPGEYEVKSIFVQGVPFNGITLYRLMIEDVAIVTLGSVKAKELTNVQLEALEGADVLIVPVGGGLVADAKEAVALINQMEPRIVIPSYFAEKKTAGLTGVDLFLKEYGAPSETTDKFKLAKKDLPQEDTTVVVLKNA